MEPPLKVAVLGAGAVGLGLASCLRTAGASVLLLVRDPEQLAALRSAGLERSGIFGAAVEVAAPLPAPGTAFSLAAELADAPLQLGEHAFDALLVCTKSNTARDAAHWLGRDFARRFGEARVVLCQNGWGAAPLFAQAVGEARVFNARITTGFRRSAPNAVEITVHGETLRIGSLFGRAGAEIAPLCDAIRTAGLPCEPSDDIERDLWAKMLYNCALNPLGALLGVPYGTLASDPPSRELMDSVIDEIFATLEASAHRTHWDSPDAYRAHFYGTLIPPTAAHESSMLQDLQAGRATEIDALSGAVCELASAHGVATPVNRSLWQLVRAAEGRA